MYGHMVTGERINSKMGILQEGNGNLATMITHAFAVDNWHWLFDSMLPDEKREKMTVLRKILFGSDVSNVEELENLIYHYGSLLNEKDYLEREIFVFLTSISHNLKNAGSII